MTRGFQTRRKDGNHNALRSLLEQLGVGVYDSADDGSPFDLILFWRGRTLLVELKDGSKPPSARKLTTKEVQLHDTARRHGCQVHIVHNADDALALIGGKISGGKPT